MADTRAFVAHLKGRGFAESTVGAYGKWAARWLAWLEECGVEPAAAGREQVSRFLAAVIAGGVSRQSAQVVQSAIRTFHAYLAEHGEGALPGPRIAFRTEERLPSVLSEEDVVRLIESVDQRDPLSLRDRALLEMLYASGLRASEVVSLRLSALDLERGTARVMGKGRREAVVCYGESARRAVVSWIEWGRAAFVRHPTDLLFLNMFGGQLKRGGLHNLIKKRASAAGLDAKVHAHVFRHSFATHLMLRGANLRVIQELLRHRSLTSTARYTKLDASRLSEERRKYHPRQ